MGSVYDGLVKPPVQPGPKQTGVTNMGKGILRSKMFWVNLLTAAVSVGTYFMDSELLVNNPDVVAGIGTAIGVVNIVLRLITKEPINGINK